MNGLTELLFPLILILLAIGLFVWLAVRLRRKGGSMISLMYGATDQFYTKEQKQAIEQMIEVQANKKWKRKNRENQNSFPI